MSKRKYTVKNPGNCGYRMPIRSGDSISIQMAGEILSVFGDVINIIGQLEEIRPLEEWLKLAKK